MGRPPCCDKANVKRGLWTAEEDAKILAYVSTHGIGNWTQVPKKAGLNRCGKSCRLRWTNYLRPDLKHEEFTEQEEELIIQFHAAIGSRWSLIAKQLPGRTDNDVKNYWNTKLKKKLFKMGIDPVTHKPFAKILSDYESISCLKTNLPDYESVSCLTTNQQMTLRNTSLATSVSSQSEISSTIVSGISSAHMGRNWMPMPDQFEDATFSSYNSFFHHQGQVEPVEHESFDHYMLEDVSPSSSSSSSSSISNRKTSTDQLTSEPSPALVMPASYDWGEKGCGDPLPTAETTEEEYNIQKFLAANSPVQVLDKSLQCQITTSANHTKGVKDEKSGMSKCKGAAGSCTEVTNCFEPSSSVNAFVKALLDRDSEMQLDFPAFDDILNY